MIVNAIRPNYAVAVAERLRLEMCLVENAVQAVRLEAPLTRRGAGPLRAQLSSTSFAARLASFAASRWPSPAATIERFISMCHA